MCTACVLEFFSIQSVHEQGNTNFKNLNVAKMTAGKTFQEAQVTIMYENSKNVQKFGDWIIFVFCRARPNVPEQYTLWKTFDCGLCLPDCMRCYIYTCLRMTRLLSNHLVDEIDKKSWGASVTFYGQGCANWSLCKMDAWALKNGIKVEVITSAKS